MAIYGGGGRMGAYGDPDAENNNNPGSLFGQLLGGLGKKFKDSLKDDKGLIQGNKDGSLRIGKKEGLDRPDSGLLQRNEDGSLRLGSYKGADINKGQGYSGDFKGVDMIQDNKGFVQGGRLVNPYKGRFAKDNPFSKWGSRIREMVGKGDPEVEGPTQPVDYSLSGAVNRTEGDITNAPNQDVAVNQETGENYGNMEVMGPLLASKVNDPSQVPAKHAGMMQKFLNTQGFQLEEDGKWGPKSTKAMAEWMQKSGTGNPLSERYDEWQGPMQPRNAVYTPPAAQVSTSRTQG